MTYAKSAVVCGLAVLATSVGGCGLISSDITTIKFGLPERSYAFDTAQAGVTLPAAQLPAIACTDDASCCALATQVGVDCAYVICVGDPDKTCAATTTIETAPQMVNLKKEVPALSSFSNQSVIDVTVSKITYDITTNTMNVDLPPIELYVGADGTTTTAGATKFGTVPVTPAGQTITGGQVLLDPAGQNAFVGFAHHFGTPFVFIAKTTLVAPGGTPIPSGGVALTIKGQLAAKPGL